jgi:hypothetical protein
MKRTILASLLAMAIELNAPGQGSIIWDTQNQGTYNPVVWGFGPNIGKPIYGGTPDTPFNTQVYFAKGSGYTSLDQLTPGITWSFISDGDGINDLNPGGYFDGPTIYLPTWQSGDVFTFCIVVTEPGYSGQSALWTEKSAIHSVSAPQSGFLNFPGMAVLPAPEPSSFALLGIAAATFATFRRRGSAERFHSMRSKSFS